MWIQFLYLSKCILVEVRNTDHFHFIFFFSIFKETHTEEPAGGRGGQMGRELTLDAAVVCADKHRISRWTFGIGKTHYVTIHTGLLEGKSLCNILISG